MIKAGTLISYATQMHLILSLLLIFHVCCLAAETVYKTVDEDGNIIFTDRPSEGAEEIKLQKLQTIKNPNPARGTHKQSTVDKGTRYNKLVVTKPEKGVGLRSNDGSVTISVSIEPALRDGHNLLIKMDGKEISNGSSSNVSLTNVDRGTHRIVVSVVSSKGRKLKTATSSFSILRANVSPTSTPTPTPAPAPAPSSSP